MSRPSPHRQPPGQLPGSEVVELERYGHAAVLTLSRPEVLNAVNAEMSLRAGEALEEIDGDPGLRVAIITGRGRAFCAGADLKALAAGERSQPPRPAWGFCGITQHVISKPLIAAVNGLAHGGGLEIAMSCDLVIASEQATFGLPEVKRGIIAGAGGLVRLAGQIPPRLAMEIALTGDPVSAPRAADLGLVNAVVDPARLMDEALALAGRIAANAPLAVQASKRVLQRVVAGARADEALGWALTSMEAAALRTSEDAREGPRAFAEKRDPVWTGR
ncbi:MAG TPA: crotonase/enoyl-CoA hydratase family protein [Streptosporangiaceae bacterium]|jgi:crotonobetainyl-CoA hydratase|nr:crotonase/enoyl-CoA hydratase family protein [Streptosporangiaceae bacterium]